MKDRVLIGLISFLLVLFFLFVGIVGGYFSQQREKIAALKKEINNLKRTNTTFREKNKLLQKRLENLQGVNNSLAEKVKELEKVKNSLEAKAKELEEVNNSLQTSRAQKNSSNSKSKQTKPTRGGKLEGGRKRKLVVIATAYSSSDPGVDRITSTGTQVKEGRTIAVDPWVIPYGSRVYIPGYGWRIAEDCGGAIKGNKIDIYFESRSEALRFGRRKMTILVQGP